MRILKIFLLCLVCFSLEATSSWKEALHQLTKEEKSSLEKFFRTMLTSSEGGYVLFGSKPLCGEGILQIHGYLLYSDTFHQRSVTLFQGWQVWEKYFASIPSKNLLICRVKNPFGPQDWKYGIYWINKKKFLETVKNHLSLFQFVLGPKLDEKNFLSVFINPSYDSTTDQTLVGILLGFGCQNSLYGKRHETIFNQIVHNETLPLAQKRLRCSFLSLPALPCYHEKELNEEKPSFSYSTLEEEWNDLQKKMKNSVNMSQSILPQIPTFGIYDMKEAKPLLHRYEKDREKIVELLKREDFLEQVLKLVFQ